MFVSAVRQRLTRTCIFVLFLALSLSLTLQMLASPRTVLAAGPMTVTISPTEGRPGTPVIATGSNFGGNDTIHVLWGGTTGQDIYHNQADSAGNFRFTFRVPNNAGQGVYTLIFWDEQQRTFQTPQSPFTVRTVSLEQVMTRDRKGNDKTAFVDIEPIQYAVLVDNSGGSEVTARFHWEAFGASRNYIWDLTRDFRLPRGLSGWYAFPNIPDDAPTGTYTYRITVSVNGVSSWGIATFQVQQRQTASNNPYPDATQCTWFADDQMHRAIGKWMPNFGNAQDWVGNARPRGWYIDTIPNKAAVVVMPYAQGHQYSYWDPGSKRWLKTSVDSSSGHVAWVDSLGCGGVKDPAGGNNCIHVVDRNWNEDGKDGQRLLWTGGGAPLSYIYSTYVNLYP